MHANNAFGTPKLHSDQPDFKDAIDDLSFRRIKKVCAQKLKEAGSDWKGYKFAIKLSLLMDIGVMEDHNSIDNSNDDNCIELPILHAITLLNDIELLLEALRKEPQIDPWLERVNCPTKLDAKEKQLLEENQWILIANCFHLAAKFNPNGLHHMLMQFKVDKSNSLFTEGTISPLHVSAINANSLSLE